MADDSFDVVIVGAGAKGMVTAMYLAKYGGMSICVLEERHEVACGLSTEQAAPGFPNNTHAAIVVEHHTAVPKRDFPELDELGCKFIPADVPVAATLEDGRCLCLYGDSVDPSGERTAKEISRFSGKDAETWLKHHELARTMWLPAMKETNANPPGMPGMPGPMDLLFFNPDSGLDMQIAFMTPWQALHTFFESKEYILLILRLLGSAGILANDAGMGAAALITPFYAQLGSFEGGTHNVAHAYHRVLVKNGVKVVPNSRVTNIIVEHGKATGVRLQNGSEIKAKKFVVTNVSPRQLCFDLLGNDYCSPDILTRIANLEDWRVCIGWFQWALRERPVYNSGDFNPDINKSTGQIHMLGTGDPMRWKRECGQLSAGIDPSDPVIYAFNQSTHDPLVSPIEGAGSTILTEGQALPAYAMTEKEWMKWHKEHAEYVMQEWHRHAPNVTWDTVIGYLPVSPYTIAEDGRNFAPAGNWRTIDGCLSQMGGNRPIPELARHKVPWVENLYCTGVAWAPGATAGFDEGYNCYKIIADDHGLRKPWEEEGYPY